MLSPPFIETCRRLHAAHPELGFVVAVVNQKRREQFEHKWRELAPELEFVLVDGTARNVIQAADVVMLASGTVALECMLVGRPMVVAYKVNAITAFIAKRLVKTEFVSLPNILAGKELVKEYLLEECHADNLYPEVERLLSGDNRTVLDKFSQMHQDLRRDADKQAAQAVLKLVEEKS
jgi:lipid-A-disaccharide synthase